MPSEVSTRAVLSSYASGLPTVDNFRIEEAPVEELLDGEVLLLRTRFVSVDANMRAHNAALASGDNTPLLGSVIEADGTAEVLRSNHPNFHAGQVVMARTGWQSHLRLRGEMLHGLESGALPEENALIMFGTSAMTAYAGLNYTAGYQAGETVVVPAANGLLAAMVGQFARMAGLWTIGIVSSREEVDFVQQQLGFQSAVNWIDPHFEKLLTEACGAGIDIYFETIGGALWRSIRPLMKNKGRVVLAGSWAQYSHAFGGAAEYGSLATIEAVLRKQLSLGTPHLELRFDDFTKEVHQGVANGSIWSHVRVENGLPNAPSAWLNAIDSPERGITVLRV